MDLATDQEEADTEIAYLMQHAANTSHDKDMVPGGGLKKISTGMLVSLFWL